MTNNTQHTDVDEHNHYTIHFFIKLVFETKSFFQHKIFDTRIL